MRAWLLQIAAARETAVLDDRRRAECFHRRIVPRLRVLAVLGVPTLFAACTYLPSSGPTGPELQSALTESNPLGVKIIEFSPSIVENLIVAGAENADNAPPPRSALPDVDRIGPGDELSVSIFQIGAGLFSGHQVGSVESESASTAPQSLPKLLVNGDGFIFVPYAGRIRAEGLTPAQLQNVIEAKLNNLALKPQVIVTIVTNISNTIVVSGDVKAPGRQKLTLAHENLLDAIALAGGTGHLAADSFVTVQGVHHAEALPLALVGLNGKENVTLEPNDRVKVDFLPRTISVFGAGGRVAQLPFDAPYLTLADALARTGGPLDYQADATAIYIFRYETPAASLQLGLTPTPVAVPVVYHVSLLDPTAYLAMPRFAMRDQDVLYIANAQSNKLQKIMGIVSGAFLPVTAAKTLTN